MNTQPPNQSIETPADSLPVVTVNQAQLAAAFTEWERRFREEPSRFMSESDKLRVETPQSYGESCAPYFMKIVAEQVKPD